MGVKKISLVLMSVLIWGMAGSLGDALAQEPFTLTSWGRFFSGIEWGYQWVAGDFVIPAGGRPGSGARIFLGPDLGADQTESVKIFTDAEILNTHYLNLDYFMCLATGLKRVQRDLLFHNKLYPENSLVDTRVDINWLRFTYAYRLFDIDSWNICPSIGIHYLRCGVTLNGENEEGPNTSNNRKLDATFPTIGVQARFLAPYGLDFKAEWEGMHLITIGLISSLQLCANWEIYPDVRLSIGVTNRLVSSIEDNQELNNEWFYNMTGFTGGIAFGF
ncbi:MAG: hypothetical protein ACLQO6_06160 [Desulfomonilaceae bacterium]